MKDPVLKISGLSKRYRIGELVKAKPDTLVGTVINILAKPFKNFKRLSRLTKFGVDENNATDVIWAIKDISLEIYQGDIVGIIGKNGAGKSTLLKILSRITDPTSGSAEIKGRVSSLLEVGTGFHPELTGRENVYLNGTILGMSKNEISDKFNDIVSFSGVEKHIDTPIKRYSSGMKVRLAFSVAAHLDPDILIIDEVLAVGDIEFQQKCLSQMDEMSSAGRTVLFVSHNMMAVSALCNKCVLLENGKITKTGPTEEIVSAYRKTYEKEITAPLNERKDREGDQKIKFENISICGKDLVNQYGPATGEEMNIILEGKIDSSLSDDFVNIKTAIVDNYGYYITVSESKIFNFTVQNNDGVFKICCRYKNLALPAGTYKIHIFALANTSSDYVYNAAEFIVQSGDFYGTGKSPKLKQNIGMYYSNHHWINLD